MKYEIFLLPLIISFAITTSFLVAFILFNKKKIIKDVRVSQRHMHKNGISRFGGVALISSFVITILLDKNLVIGTPLIGVLFASIIILVLGVIDDLKQLSWKTQFIFQLITVVIVCAMGVRLAYITNPFGGILSFTGTMGYFISCIVSIVWVLFIMNAVNWIDGDDGIAGGVTIIGALAMFFLSMRPEVNQPPMAIIAMVLVGSLAAFLFFNFHPAKIIAGTSGAIFMGFILAIMAIFAGAKIATTLLILAVPIIDALWVIIQRLKMRESIFSADKKHLHFRLRELGWSSRRICFFYYAITALIGLIALNIGALGKVIAFMLIVIIMTGALFIIDRKIFSLEKNK